MKLLNAMVALLLMGVPINAETRTQNQEDYIRLLETENHALRETINNFGFKELETKIELNVCDINATFKSYMDYRAITDVSSPHYALVRDALVNDYGILLKEGRLVVAMANQYGDVGQKLDITLSTGNKLKVILGDIKGTQCTHQDGSMLEFIIDSTKVTKKQLSLGNYDNVYQGSIIKIEGGE